MNINSPLIIPCSIAQHGRKEKRIYTGTMPVRRLQLHRDHGDGMFYARDRMDAVDNDISNLIRIRAG